MSRANELVAQIVKSAGQYYRGEELDLSDEQFDQLVNELKKIDPDNPIIHQVGWGYKPEGETSLHRTFIGSLDKLKYPEVCSGLEGGALCSPKFDGGSVVCTFVSGYLVKALTRGDGKTGVDITEKMRKIIGNDVQVNLMESALFRDNIVDVRGEVVVDKKFEEKLNVISLRNYANGVLNRKEGWEDDCQCLRFVAYSVPYSLIDTPVFNDKFLLMGALTVEFDQKDMMKFNLTKSIDPPSLMDIFCHAKKTLFIDGLVITKKDIRRSDDGCYFENSLAYKFESERADVKVTDIEWNTGSTGRIIPTVIFEPVKLSGAMLQRATGHNGLFIYDNKIGIGSTIRVCRSGEVIPYVVDCVSSGQMEFPEFCPECGADVAREGVHIICTNDQCTAKIRGSIDKLIDISGKPKGVSTKLIDKFLEMEPFCCAVKTFEDFLVIIKNHKLDNNRIYGIFGNHYGKLIIEMITNLKNKVKKGFYVDEFWIIQNINGVGESNASKIPDPKVLIKAEDMKHYNDMMKECPSNVVVNVLNTAKIWSGILQVLDILYMEKIDGVSLKVVVTGKLSVPRPEYTKKLKQLGITVGSAVTKDTNYLITNNPESTSSKAKKARKFNIPVVTEDQFRNIVEEVNGK